MSEHISGTTPGHLETGSTLTDRRQPLDAASLIDHPHSADTNDTESTGLISRVREKLHSRSDIIDELQDAMPSKEQAQRLGSRILGSMKDSVQTIREKAPEFMSRHKSKIGLAAGAFATARTISTRRQNSNAKIEIPISRRAARKIKASPTELRELVHNKTA